MTRQTQYSPWIALFQSARLLFPLAALLGIVMFQLLPDSLSPTLQLAILAIVILFFGLPHGALDPWIAQQIGLSNTSMQVVVFNCVYLAIAALVVLVWLWLPVLSLSVFLLISAWHFSGDWSKSLNIPLRLAAGALLLLMPIGFHTETVATIFEQLSGLNGGALSHSLALPVWFLTTSMLAVIGGALWKQQWQCAFELFTLLTLAYLTPPLVYFTLYFCLLHSPRHLTGLLIAAPTPEHPRLARMMVVYTAATIALLGVLWWLWSALPTNTLILKLTFIGLAAVTVPHMMLICTAQLKTR